jgi:hypothetical protein
MGTYNYTQPTEQAFEAAKGFLQHLVDKGELFKKHLL